MTRHPRTVEDVMTTSVVSADPLTPYKEIARLLAERRISGLPVLVGGWQVVGVVSESDLLAAQDQAARQVHARPASPTPTSAATSGGSSARSCSPIPRPLPSRCAMVS